MFAKTNKWMLNGKNSAIHTVVLKLFDLRVLGIVEEVIYCNYHCGCDKLYSCELFTPWLR